MAWFELFLVSPWGAVAVLALIVVLVAVILRHRRRSGGIAAAEPDAEAPTAAESADAVRDTRS